MTHKPAKPDGALVHASCTRADGGLTAGFEPAASIFGPEASMQVEEVPLFAREGFSHLSMDLNTRIEYEDRAATQRRESRMWIQSCLIWRN